MSNTQTVTVPIRTVSEANSREHWKKKASRTRVQRDTVMLFLTGERVVAAGNRLLVTLTRIAPCQLDDDNLARSMKAIRDEVARYLGYDDAPDSPIEWRYDQRKGRPREYAVVITITADPVECPTCGRI